MGNRIIAILTTIILFVTCTTSVFAEILPNFNQTEYYDETIYSDVYISDWYYNYVGFAYEYQIMSGTANGIFEPKGNITVAEAITVASRLNAKYYGNNIASTIALNGDNLDDYHIDSYLSQISMLDDNDEYSYAINGNANFDIIDEEIFDGELKAKTKRFIKIEELSDYRPASGSISWFMPYLTYAVEQGIITPNEFSGYYSTQATRAQVAYLIYKALPQCFEQINDISPIPDVETSNRYYTPILTMYESGVLTGADEYGTFYPNNHILRSEVATMVSRVINTDLRQRFVLNQNRQYVTINYQWQYPYNGQVFNLPVDISYYDYNYFASKPRTYEYGVYARDIADDTSITMLAETLRDMAIDNGFSSSYDHVGFIAAFVQCLEYQTDLEYKGAIEYPKYPIETLFEKGGDCEDTAVLLAKMLRLIGYGTVLLVSDNHMAVGVQTNGVGNIEYDGIQYYYVETTEFGWRVGEVPNDMLGVRMQVMYI